MKTLADQLLEECKKWRKAGYPCDRPEIAELFEYQFTQNEEEDLGENLYNLRYLRKPQLESLEIYFYLRYVLGSPHTLELYRKMYAKDAELAEILRLPCELKTAAEVSGIENILKKIKEDNDFVHKWQLDTLREMANLDYASYIFALTMGTGKTLLIGTIILFEFAISLASGDKRALKNALVFAGGKTIFESLRKLQNFPFDEILPPRLRNEVVPNVRFSIAGTSANRIVLPGSSYNIVITNTEKIRIQAKGMRTKKDQLQIKDTSIEEKVAQANLRLQNIASLSQLGVFSDEAHNLYGSKAKEGIKRVRETVDYLHDNIEGGLKVVVNTTGTPYAGKQMLHEVVMWYGLTQGIEDGILKSLEGSVRVSHDVRDEEFLQTTVQDFFATYGSVKTPEGTPAKLAMYFPDINALRESRSIIERTMAEVGHDSGAVLENTSKAPLSDIEEFKRFGTPESPYRIALLVGKGTEGWDCPPLFACALARDIKSSNNLVLQSATRCLRQVRGNSLPGRIYLSEKNAKTLSNELKKAVGVTLQDVNGAEPLEVKKILLKKTNIPPIEVRFEVKRLVQKPDYTPEKIPLRLSAMPKRRLKMVGQALTPQKTGSLTNEMRFMGTDETNQKNPRTLAGHFARKYGVSYSNLLAELQRIAPEGGYTEQEQLLVEQNIVEHLGGNGRFTTETRIETQALAIIKPEGFLYSQAEQQYYGEVRYSKRKEHLVLPNEASKKHGWHYEPYVFDSKDEKEFYAALLKAVELKPEQVEDVYFIGGITNPEKTDIYFWYKTTDNTWARYYPDFLVRRKDGKCYIVEVKPEGDLENNVVTQRKKAKMQEITAENAKRIHYEVLEAPASKAERLILESDPTYRRITDFLSQKD